ncbi:hypothetical protein XENOCAPTIV_028411 [Xenoophorus captivus]|uniref:Chaperone DnaJ C-terminal domain-containing protein n=1 Tax=Xenoophorus captivus TaxID=1517983 RepID=A0ABV0RP42_9TELE
MIERLPGLRHIRAAPLEALQKLLHGGAAIRASRVRWQLQFVKQFLRTAPRKHRQVQQLGPGMIQQIQSMCPDCQGQGEKFNSKDRCKNCNGHKVERKKKILEVHIDKGMKDGQKITFHGEGDQEPGLEPGDVIIVLDQKEHPRFQRQGNDLIMKMDIKLAEALCGFRKTIQTLDNRMLIVSTKPGTVTLYRLASSLYPCCCLVYRCTDFCFVTGEVIKHNDIKFVQNEGMPIHRDPYERGMLIVQFQVEFPENHWLPEHLMFQLERLLPPREDVMITDDMEEVDLCEVDLNSQQKRYHGEAYEEDEERPRGGVQCQTQ